MKDYIDKQGISRKEGRIILFNMDKVDLTASAVLLTAFAGIVIPIIVSYLERKGRLEFEKQKLKEQYYLEFVQALSENMNSGETEEVTIRYNHAFNNLVIIANPMVLNSLYALSDLIIKHLKENNVINYDEKYNQAFTCLIKKMRKDIHGEKINKGITNIYCISGVAKKKKANGII